MAQSGFTPIQLYSSPTPGAAPAASNLTDGEVAINVADGKLFYKNTDGNTQVIANSAYSTGVAIQGSGTNVVANGTVQFANSNGVTFGLNGSTVTASVTVPTSGIQAIQGSGTNTVNAGTVQFANSNGVTFGLNGSTMTASVAAATQSVASYNIISAGGNTAGALTTFSSGTIVLAGGSNITLSQNSNTISFAAAGGGNITVSAGTTSTATNNVVFASSYNVSFGMTSNTVTAGQFITYYVPNTELSPYTFSGATYSTNLTFQDKTFSNGTNIALIYPVRLTNSLVFQNAVVSVSFPTTVSQNISFITSDSTASSNYGASLTYSLFNAMYTKTGDTFSTHNKVDYQIYITQNTNLSRGAPSGGTVTYTISGYSTLSYPTSTNSAGLLYLSSTSSETYSFTSTTSATSVALKANVGFTSIFNSFGDKNIISMANSAPLTLSPNTYFVLFGATTSGTKGKGLIGLNDPFINGFVNLFGETLGSINVNSLINIEGLSGNVMGGSASFDLSQYGKVFASVFSSGVKSIVFTGYSFTTLYSAASFASTAFSSTLLTSANNSWIVPFATYR